MTKDMQPFVFRGAPVRVVTDDNGDPWFVAKDVCTILGTETRDVRKILEPDDVTSLNTIHIGGISTIPGYDATNGGRAPILVSEPGLYTLIMGSRKTEAKEFKRWVTHDVLPSIRKHGAYMTDDTLEKAITSPDFLIELATQLKAERARKEQALAQVEAQKPKVLFADSVATSSTSILIGAFANDLKQNGVDIGQNRLFKWLRDNGYLISRKGEGWNQPTQRALDMGLFEVKTRTIENPDGSVRTTRTTKLTGKGRIYFTNKFLGNDRTEINKGDGGTSQPEPHLTVY